MQLSNHWTNTEVDKKKTAQRELLLNRKECAGDFTVIVKGGYSLGKLTAILDLKTEVSSVY